ncbi:MAG TPA: LemA family protein, partial [Candidatus Dormibacteraeota bacterium]|nr:LemA family protein [Candidatus Dormibacteraeota bacterium]
MNLTKQAKTTAIVLAVTLTLGLWIAGNYNSLVTGKNSVDNSWSKVETQYQRRFDLIDNLVAS